jgi:hypothetical protein
MDNLTPAFLDKLVLANILRIICNESGVGNEILVYAEGLRPCTEFSAESLPLHKIALVFGIDERDDNAILLLIIIIFWLICELPAQFPRFRPLQQLNLLLVRARRRQSSVLVLEQPALPSQKLRGDRCHVCTTGEEGVGCKISIAT